MDCSGHQLFACAGFAVHVAQTLERRSRVQNGDVVEQLAVAVESARHRLEDGDVAWEDFLAPEPTGLSFAATPEHLTNILFSSGTTGDPKAIPWTQLTPLKCALDAHFHHDVHPGDVVCWPTNVGWMMGPWLVYASLLNGATMALYEGAPTGEGFTRFVFGLPDLAAALFDPLQLGLDEMNVALGS